MMSYDPAFANTASCASKITYIDGDQGFCATAVIRSRSWPKKAHIGDRLPDFARRAAHEFQLKEWNYHITHHTFIHESIKKFSTDFTTTRTRWGC